MYYAIPNDSGPKLTYRELRRLVYICGTTTLSRLMMSISFARTVGASGNNDTTGSTEEFVAKLVIVIICMPAIAMYILCNMMRQATTVQRCQAATDCRIIATHTCFECQRNVCLQHVYERTDPVCHICAAENGWNTDGQADSSQEREDASITSSRILLDQEGGETLEEETEEEVRSQASTPRSSEGSEIFYDYRQRTPERRSVNQDRGLGNAERVQEDRPRSRTRSPIISRFNFAT